MNLKYIEFIILLDTVLIGPRLGSKHTHFQWLLKRKRAFTKNFLEPFERLAYDGPSFEILISIVKFNNIIYPTHTHTHTHNYKVPEIMDSILQLFIKQAFEMQSVYTAVWWYRPLYQFYINEPTN